MYRRGKIIWSPVEIEYLKRNRDNFPLTQLCIALAKSVNAIKNKLKEFDGKEVDTKKRKSSIGKRKDLGIFVRSSWEANFCRYLNYKKIKWYFEPKVFIFNDVKRGTISYLPDIYLPEEDVYVEIKGMLTSKGRTAINRFKKYYPSEFSNLRAVVGRPGTKADKFFKSMSVPIIGYMNELNKEYSNKIPNWES